MRTAYTRKEFEAKYNNPAIKDFFKHIDRKTTQPDFFEFFGISKSMLKAENQHDYSIPFEAAPLLAAMIQSFQYAYGTDRRGYSKQDTIPLSYEKYHCYIDEMQTLINQFEPYQKALIKNYRSYDLARVIDGFIPFLIERIAVLMLMLFSHSGELVADALIETIRSFDKIIEGLAGFQLEGTESALNQLEYSFEDAISGAFHVLAGFKMDSPNYDRVNSTELEEILVTERRKAEKASNSNSELDVDSQRKIITKHLNKQYEDYLLTHQDTNKIHDENIEYELSLTKKRWEASSQMELYMLSWMPDVRREIERCIQMRNGLGDFTGFQERFHGTNADSLDCDAYDELEYSDKCLYNSYAFWIGTYKTNDCPGSKEYKQFVEQKIQEYADFMKKEAEIQSELQQDPCRMRIIDIYQQEKKNKQFKAIQDILGSMVTMLLTREFGKQNKSNDQNKGEGQE